MKTGKRLAWALSLGLFGAVASQNAMAGRASASVLTPAYAGSISVMTYNVKGGPWPIAHHRGPDLAAIGDRLAQLRADGRNPHVVLLQEAFSGQARSIARRGGYSVVVEGPAASDRTKEAISVEDTKFLAGGRPWHGEGLGKMFDSGVMVLSDYPVTNIRRIAYPKFACAGLDCMANKGAVLVTIDVPGAVSPVDVVATHLNSRHSSRVRDDRSLYAYQRQVALLSAFIAANRNPDHPLIVAGDFNVGRAPLRGAALNASLPLWSGGAPVTEALHSIVADEHARGAASEPGVDAVLARNTDFEFTIAGRRAALVPMDTSVSFGREPSGRMLSDHIGYSVTFGIASRPSEKMSLAAPAG